MYWFNTPMTVLKSQEVFNRLLKPAIENPNTKKVEFVLDNSLKEFFQAEVQPKIDALKGKEKVRSPIFKDIKETLGFRMIDTDEKEEKKEAQLTFLDEPFTIARSGEGEKLKEVYLKYSFG
jgi:hypothetical protein